MFKEKRHVGRPSNDELKQRRNKKIVMISLPIVIVLVGIFSIQSGLLSNLMGNSVIYYCPDNYILKGNKCVKIEAEYPYLVGDVDKDGEVSIVDVTVIERYMNNTLELDEIQKLVADINKDSKIDGTDKKIIQNYIVSALTDEEKKQYNIAGKICRDNFKLDGNYCIKETSVDASTKASNVSTDDNSSSNSSDNSSSNSSDNSSTSENQSSTSTFTVNFNANGGTGTMKSIAAEYKKQNKVPKNEFTKQDNVFAGWYVQNDETKEWQCYLDETKKKENWADEATCKKYGKVLRRDETIVNHTTSPGKSVTFFAQWTEGFRIKFNANGGTGEMVAQTIVYGESTSIKANAFKKTNYGFNYWTIYNETRKKWLCYNANKEERYLTSNECKNGYVHRANKQKISQTGLKGETLVFYAQWTDKYTIKFNANGGTGTMKDITPTFGKDYTTPANSFKKSGYSFAGWTYCNKTIGKCACYKDSNKKTSGWADEATCKKYGYVVRVNKTVVNHTVYPAETAMFYAQWKKNGSSGGTTTPSVPSDGGSTTPTKKYTCPSGYTLSGTWCTKTVNATKSTKNGCPSSSYTKSGDNCTISIDPVVSYSCKSGYTKVGDGPTATCTKEKWVAATAKKVDTCVFPASSKAYDYNISGDYCYGYQNADLVCGGCKSSGYTCYNYNTCSKVVSKTSCPSGYKDNGIKCYKTTTSCPSGYHMSGNYCVKSYVKYTCPSGYSSSGGRCCKSSGGSYSCPSGYTRVQGSRCQQRYSQSYCPSGYYLSGSWCKARRGNGKTRVLSRDAYRYATAKYTPNQTCTSFKTTTVTDKTNIKYNTDYKNYTTTKSRVYEDAKQKKGCSGSGWTYSSSNSSCTATVKKTTKTVYSCASGQKLKDKKCRTYEYDTTVKKQSCPNGYSYTNNKCHMTVKATSNTYTCPSGYALNGTKCTATVAATYK